MGGVGGMDRYFLTLTGVPEFEVTKERYVYEERAAGFRSKFGPDEPATSYWGVEGISGRIECAPTPPPVPPAAEPVGAL